MSKVVIGLGFGDEGKGATTSWLSSRSPDAVVVRYSGGHQAGHHVYLSEERQHVFASFGSGALHGNSSMIAETCVVHPPSVVREASKLAELGIKPDITIMEDCPLTTPLDISYNQAQEDLDQYGSCGCGINATLRREEDHHHITVGDIRHPEVLRAKLDMLEQHYYEVPVPWDKSDYLTCCAALASFARIQDSELIAADDIIYEGSQGLLLDKDIGFFPHVTPYNVGLLNHRVQGFLDAYYVTRAYATRHGNGPMLAPPPHLHIEEGPMEINKTNQYQGEFRRSMLNVDLLRYGLERDLTARADRRNLMVTCLEHINQYQYYVNGRVKELPTERGFCEELARDLGMHHVYMMREHQVTEIGEVNGI